MNGQRDQKPLTKEQRQDSIFIGCALATLGLVAGIVGIGWTAGLSGIGIGVGVIVWSVWQRQAEK